MKTFSAEERRFARTIERMNYSNPFLPERIDAERAALGGEFVELDAEWNRNTPQRKSHSNLINLYQRVVILSERLAGEWCEGRTVPTTDSRLYEALVLYRLYHQYNERFDAAIDLALAGKGGEGRMLFYRDFARDHAAYLDRPGIPDDIRNGAEFLFASFFQIRRAFRHIHHFLVGTSRPMAQLRGAIWQSIFTHDMERYRRVLSGRMSDFPTLITGPSGTGKELVARAIGLSRFMKFDARTLRFEGDFLGSFFALNLSALSPTLIESELFGHRKGAFTGAVDQRAGWLETCPPTGAVFLDEIGEVALPIQVKLLRVLQERVFQPIGDTTMRTFAGKLIAATNRDLSEEMRAGRFREDFYYRLNADQVSTPSLREQLVDSPGELASLILFVSKRLLGAGDDAEVFAKDSYAWIEKNLGAHYPWPGNFRELEQCLRNLLIRRAYTPPKLSANSSETDWWGRARLLQLTADQLLGHYCAAVHAETGNFEESARRLELDRRTVKTRVLSAKP